MLSQQPKTQPGAAIVSIESGAHRQKVRNRRDELVAQHIGLVEPIARAMAPGLPPSFPVEDLVQEGMIGLLRAATRYRPEAHPGVPFRLYARRIIRGAMLDSVRGKNWREATMAPTDLVPAVIDDHDSRIDREQRTAKVKRAIAKLEPRCQRVIETHYSDEGGDFAATGKILSIDRRRVGEVHNRALGKLRVMCAGA